MSTYFPVWGNFVPFISTDATPFASYNFKFNLLYGFVPIVPSDTVNFTGVLSITTYFCDANVTSSFVNNLPTLPAASSYPSTVNVNSPSFKPSNSLMLNLAA